VFYPLNPVPPDRPRRDRLSPFQSGYETVTNNLLETDALISGNIYIYDLVEQRNLSGSCSITSLLGYHANDLAVTEPLGLADLIHLDDLNRVAEHFQRMASLRYNEAICIEYRMRRADGQWCWLRSQETPLVMAMDGFPLQILGIIHVMEPGSTLDTSRE